MQDPVYTNMAHMHQISNFGAGKSPFKLLKDSDYSEADFPVGS